MTNISQYLITRSRFSREQQIRNALGIVKIFSLQRVQASPTNIPNLISTKKKTSEKTLYRERRKEARRKEREEIQEEFKANRKKSEENERIRQAQEEEAEAVRLKRVRRENKLRYVAKCQTPLKALYEYDGLTKYSRKSLAWLDEKDDRDWARKMYASVA